jgi:hypothetical protein
MPIVQDAHVVCRQAGFPLGALEAVLHSKFGAGKDINLDELDCTGKKVNSKVWNFLSVFQLQTKKTNALMYGVGFRAYD